MRTHTHSPFGQKLRYWRRLRGLSQLALAVEAEVSPRHVSFIETGRSRPGRELIIRLADTLGVPHRERNALMQAAGFSPLYPERALSEDQLAPYRRIIQRILKSHEPYPAFVLDRWWNIADANGPTTAFYPPLAAAGNNLIDVFIADLQPFILNWGAVGWNLHSRLRQDWGRSGHDERLHTLMKRLEDNLEGTAAVEESADAESPAITVQFDWEGQTISTVGTILAFDTAWDVTLAELRIELFFPTDAPSEAFFNRYDPSGAAVSGETSRSAARTRWNGST